MALRDYIVVAGTDTGVGKTWVGAALISALKAEGIHLGAAKPVQSYEEGAGPTDAEVLAAAAGVGPEDVCPRHRSLPLPLAPPMAAEQLGMPRILMSDLVKELEQRPEGGDLGRGVGGPLSPIAHDGDTASLAAVLGPRLVILVADPGLGTINHVALAMRALSPLSTVVYLNRYEEDVSLHRLNRAWLVDRLGFEVISGVAELARHTVSVISAEV